MGGKVTPVITDSKRICAVSIEHANKRILLVNVYMPGEDKQGEYIETLQSVAALRATSNYENVIIGGDFNVDRVRIWLRNTGILEEFIISETLCDAGDLGVIDYTFESKINFSRSRIDHFFISENLYPIITACKVTHDMENLSDHSALVLTLDIEVNYEEQIKRVNQEQRVNWDRVNPMNVLQYQLSLDKELNDIDIPLEMKSCRNYLCENHKVEIENLHDQIVNACVKAGMECFPLFRQSTKTVQNGTPGWNDQVRDTREHAIFWHSLWKSAGSPRQGIIADIRRTTRMRYHHAIKRLKIQNTTRKQTAIAEAYMERKDKDFWNLINKLKGHKKPMASKVDDADDDHSIAEMFANKFEHLYSSVGYDQEVMTELKLKINTDIVNECQENKCKCVNHIVTPKDVRTAIKRLNKGKHEGFHQLFSDHIIYGTDKLDEYLAILFTAMLVHSYIPDGFKNSVIIPIPKNARKSLSSSENYRGITLGSIIGKVFDHIIIEKCPDIFTSSDLQFGFKSKHSTTQCTFAMQNTIDYYNKNGTNVYAMLLDASKAFDRVQYVKLFELLRKKGCCPLIARFLARLYTSQKCCVKWGHTHSRQFNVQNGIKQGGVLSPVLFCIYMDELLLRLKGSKFGCYIGHIFMGAFGYADDIVVLSPMKQGLLRMLDICDTFAEEYEVLFNPIKSILLFFGKKGQNENISISWNGKIISAEERAKHLGHYVGRNVDNYIMDEVIGEMYKRTNCILSFFGYCDYEIKYKLFKTYVMPLYGSVLWDYTHGSFDRMLTAWRKCIRRLIRVHPRTHSVLLPQICRDHPPHVQLYKRYIKFFKNCQGSTNEHINICSKLVENGLTSRAGNLTTVCNLFELDRNNFKNVNINILVPRIPADSATSAAIRELLSKRDNRDYEFFSRDQLDHLIGYLCTEHNL